MNIRRYYVPNTFIFITQVVHQRSPVFANDTYLNLLRAKMHAVKELHPFSMLAYVFLPDHFHFMIRPTGASNFSQIMKSIKINFVYDYKQVLGINDTMKFWQKRFWDHIIRDEEDFERRLDYTHYNPVKHGYATRPEDWPHSSFLYWKEKGVYPDRWGWSLPDALKDFKADEFD